MKTEIYTWLVLIYYLPPAAGSTRVRVWRKMKKLGTVSFRNSVYFLPHSEDHYEILQWLCQEIQKAGGEATLLKTSSVENLTNEEVAGFFRKPRSEEYHQIAEAAAGLHERMAALDSARRTGGADVGAAGMTILIDELGSIRKRFDETREIDFFDAPGRSRAEEALGRCRQDVRRLKKQEKPVAEAGEQTILSSADFKAKTWVTRPRLFVDRIATAWAISRFIDPEARFEFSEHPGAVKGAIPFDYIDADLSHQGEDCTFETLVKRFGLEIESIGDIAEIVHDVDLKDAKFNRREAAGLEIVLKGLAATNDDGKLLAGGLKLFDQLYAGLKARRAVSKTGRRSRADVS